MYMENNNNEQRKIPPLDQGKNTIVIYLQLEDEERSDMKLEDKHTLIL